jgi:iron(III) transport system ATP-binding protein
MRDEIRRIQRDVGITTVYVTHDQSEAMAMSDKIVILKDGLVQQIDSPQRIYQRPNNVFISNFIGKANIIGGTIISCENNRAEIDIEGITFSVPEKIEYKAGTKVEIVIRPESVLVGKKGFTAKVTKSVYMGSTQDYRVEFDSHKIEISDNNPTSKRVYAEGENMEFSLDSDSIHIL